MSNCVIAIDGPSASGKSTVARAVAARLGYLYADSGAVYRGLTWQMVRLGIGTADAAAVAEAVRRLAVDFEVAGCAVRMRIGGVDPGQEIRSRVVGERVSDVAAIPAVRQQVNCWLRAMAELGDLVMEGRDIGSVVFPQAAHKVYLDAQPEERARRRHADFLSQREPQEVQQVLSALQQRDRKDSGRTTAPLTVAPGAVVIDTTAQTADEVAQAILRHVGQGR